MGRSAWKSNYIAKKIWKIGFFQSLRKRRIFKDKSFIFKYIKIVIGKPERFRINVTERSSVIPSFLKRKTIRIYKGKTWRILKLSSWFYGFKFGEFGKTRKYVKFKSKASKKALKKNKKSKENFEKIINDPQIQKIKLIKSGDLRRRSDMFENLDKRFSLGYKKIAY